MTKPLELQNALTAQATAWDQYFTACDNNQAREMIEQRYNVCVWLTERVSNMFLAWQKMGGTSDIETLSQKIDWSEADFADLRRTEREQLP